MIVTAQMHEMMDRMMGWGGLMMLLGIILLVALIVFVVVAIMRIAHRNR